MVDLERNDLGAICDYGSVQVKDLLRLESYEHVFHLVSTVEGRLRRHRPADVGQKLKGPADVRRAFDLEEALLVFRIQGGGRVHEDAGAGGFGAFGLGASWSCGIHI